MNPNINKVHNSIKKNKNKINKIKKYTQSQINRCEITIMVMNSRGKHKTEHKTMEIQTYIHAFINKKLHNYYILFLSHLPSCVLKLMSVLQEVICLSLSVSFSVGHGHVRRDVLSLSLSLSLSSCGTLISFKTQLGKWLRNKM